MGVRLMPPSAGASDFTGTLEAAAALTGAFSGCPTYIDWDANRGCLRCIIIHNRQGLSLMICKPAQHYYCGSLRLLMGDAASSSASALHPPYKSTLGRRMHAVHVYMSIPHRIVVDVQRAGCFAACPSIKQTSLKVPARPAHTCMLAEVDGEENHGNRDPALYAEKVRVLCTLATKLS